MLAPGRVKEKREEKCETKVVEYQIDGKFQQMLDYMKTPLQ